MQYKPSNSTDVQAKGSVLVPFFDRDTTSIIKGVALVMMFVHHFFTFPNWWVEGISYPLMEKLAPYFCQPLKLCVPIFCFITGYFYHFNKNKSYKYSIRKITDILISYWTVFFLLAVIAAVFAKYHYTFLDFIAECFALKRPTMFFCWYVSFYVIFMLLLPLIAKIMTKGIHFDLFFSLIFIPIIFRVIGRFVHNSIILELIADQKIWLPCVLIGYVFGKYGFFEKIRAYQSRNCKNQKVNIVLMVIVALCVPFGRIGASSLSLKFEHFPALSISMDVIYAPIFIYAVAYICNAIDIRALKTALIHVGKYSMLMWFVSCIFFDNCKGIFQPILYFPHNPVLVTIWGLIMCFSASFLLDKTIKKVQNRKDRLLGL